jgi:hypothetical protein
MRDEARRIGVISPSCRLCGSRNLINGIDIQSDAHESLPDGDVRFWNKAALCAFARLGYSLRGDLRVTELVERYRLNAEKCLQLAQNFQELQAKRELLVMANAWLVLAMQREKNIETAAANDSTSPINERPLELR